MNPLLARAAVRLALAGSRRCTVAGENNAVGVHVLTCSRDIELAIVALRTLFGHLGPAAALFHTTIWDDGSLRQRDLRRLDRALPGVTAIGRREIELLVATGPHADTFARFWSIHPMHLKLLIPVIRPDPEVPMVLMDSDIVFFRFPNELVAWAQTGADNVRYNAEMDRRSTDSLLRGGFVPKRTTPSGRVVALLDPPELDRLSRAVGTRLRPAPNLNAGFLLLPGGLHTASRVAALLDGLDACGYYDTASNGPLLEQFAHIVLIGTYGVPVPLPPQYYCFWRPKPTELTMRHFIGMEATASTKYLRAAAGALRAL